jgi:hypothetical protein
MKTPPFLIGAALLFWGYQTGFLPEGAVMALILESSRFIRARWEFSDDEFARVWTFSFVLLLAAVIFAFNNNGGPSGFTELLQNPNVASERDAGNASTMTADALFRWLPMIFFLFIAAQTFSPADGISLEVISPYLRSRQRRARKRGVILPPSRRFDVSYPYFALCLFSAGGRAPQNDYYYYGLCALIGWALWPQRSRRFAFPVWLGLLAVSAVIGFWGQRGFTEMVRLAGQYDPQLLSLFWPPRTDARESRTDIGNFARMKMSGKIIIRVEMKNGLAPPTYLREATYREASEIRRQLVWEAGNTNADNDWPQVYETPRESNIWPLNSNPANRSTVTIASYLNEINPNDKYPDGLLPLPPDCNRLESLRAYFVYQNNIGAVLCEGPRLVIFDAHYGSGSIMDAPPEADTLITNQDLRISLTNEIPALRQVASSLDVSNRSEDEKILAVTRFFASTNFAYSLWQDAPRASDTNATPLARFLLETRRGHCEYFASATVLLLRELGIPARYVVGYYVHEVSGHGYVVRMRDAHAWCIYWDQKKHAWQTLDTTPGTWVSDEAGLSSPLQFISDFQSWVRYQVLKFFEYGHSNIREYLFWTLIPALAFLLYRIFRSSRRHRKGGDQQMVLTWPGLDSEFYRLERKLAQTGIPRQAGEPLTAWMQRATNDERLAELKEPLENVLQLHYRYRFDPRGLNPSERQALRREVEACLSAAPIR